jgi:CRISPR-associated protein Cas5h
MDEQFLAFDWHGFIAHFRKMDTNSSSMSYSFPPPTVITGMLAGICGMERDQYYSIFTPANLALGIQIRKKPRKIMQTVNYMFAKSRNDFNLSASTPHTQIPVELLVASSFPSEFLTFRIFLKLSEPALYEVLNSFLVNSRQLYLPYLGSAPFSSWLEYKTVKNISVDFEATESHSVVPSKVLKNIPMMLENSQDPVAIHSEHMRRYFKNDREPGDLVTLVWEQNKGIIRSEFDCPVYCLEIENEVSNVIFF